jgi:hypothetical protein
MEARGARRQFKRVRGPPIEREQQRLQQERRDRMDAFNARLITMGLGRETRQTTADARHLREQVEADAAGNMWHRMQRLSM